MVVFKNGHAFIAENQRKLRKIALEIFEFKLTRAQNGFLAYTAINWVANAQ